MTLRTRNLRWLSDRRGNAMIEFALSFALLFPVFIGCFEFGYAFYNYNELATAVRGGARYASLRSYDSASETPSANYLAAVRNTVLYGDPTGGSTPVIPGIVPENVTVEVTFEIGVPRTVTVGVDNYTLDAVVKMVNFTTKPRVSVPYVGRYDPL